MAAPSASSPSVAPALLPAGTGIGAVTLRVSDAERSLAWYRDMMGLEVVDRSDGRIALGAGGQAFLFLDVRPGTEPRREETTGLYHVAILVPDRPALGGALTRIARERVKLGASDHIVSEALYIWDPDNNGLEIYRDRPREEWVWEDGRVHMATDPLDMRNLATEGLVTGSDRKPIPAGTRIGHVHLQVGDLDLAKRYYCGALGFEETSSRRGALFVSAGRYHHHVGLNVWHSRNGPRPAENAAGLVEFEVVVPNREAVAAARARLEAAGHVASDAPAGFRVADPWHIRIRLRAAT